MSTAGTRHGGSSGPRQPPGPRGAGGRRGPSAPRRPGQVSGAGIAPGGADPGLAAASRLAQPSELADASPLAEASSLAAAPALAAPPDAPQPSSLAAGSALADASPAGWPAALEPAAEPDPTGEPKPAPATPPPGSGQLTGLRLLLDQLDALLRDPTFALWLKAATAKLADGVRGAAAALADALRRLRLPRRLLLGLLALLLPLALLALLSGDEDDRSTTASAPPRASAPAASLTGVTMPDLSAADERPGPVRVALVLDRTYAPAELRRELRALGAWLGEHHSAGTRVTIIDAQSARASTALRASDLAAGQALRAGRSTPAAIRAALGRRQDRRLLVTLGSTAPALGSASTLSITPRRGAAASPPSRSGRRSRAAIDDRRPNALAATVARAIMSVSGQREQR